MRNSRKPIIGDILFVSSKMSSHTYRGMVYDILLDNWGHQRNVFVHWMTDIPDQGGGYYNQEHGYCGVNIHNLRSVFKIIRDGVEIN
tara:strand:- start:689 stop:949 length:261 start_codon:yes stop_codon:yes gene_type:complete